MSLSKSVFKESLDASLRKFAEKIQVEEEDYTSEGIRLCENLRKTLEDDLGGALHSSCSYFARRVTVGTEPPFQVEHPDFAIILKFFNLTLFALDEMEAESQSTLRKNKTVLEIVKISTTSDPIRITFKNGMCAYLLLENTTKDGDIDELLQKIKCRGDPRRFQSASVSFQQSKLMKTLTQFNVLLIRLINHWLKSKDMKYGSGVKYIVELLAIVAVTEEGENFQESMTSALIKVAKDMESLDKLQLELELTTDDISENECESYGSGVREGVPCIMEPLSRVPNNLLDECNIKREQIEVLMKTGMEMRGNLEEFMEKCVFNVSVGTEGDGVIDCSELFAK